MDTLTTSQFNELSVAEKIEHLNRLGLLENVDAEAEEALNVSRRHQACQAEFEVAKRDLESVQDEMREFEDRLYGVFANFEDPARDRLEDLEEAKRLAEQAARLQAKSAALRNKHLR